MIIPTRDFPKDLTHGFNISFTPNASNSDQIGLYRILAGNGAVQMFKFGFITKPVK